LIAARFLAQIDQSISGDNSRILLLWVASIIWLVAFSPRSLKARSA
jgi:hypothetical protein